MTTTERQQSLATRLWNDPAIRTALVVFLVLRVITAVVAYGVVSSKPPTIDYDQLPLYSIYSDVFTTQGPLRPWLEPWYRWDTGWYLSIAYRGYSPFPESIIFPPLYPFTIRLLGAVIGDYLVAALIISNVSCFIMLVLLYKLVASEFGPSMAELTLQLMVTFPAAFYFVAAYSESLFMALLLGSWLATTKRYYLLAGVLAFLASLTRSQGWVLALPLGYIAYIQHLNLPHELPRYVHNPWPLFQRLPVLLGGILGTAAYLLGMQLSGLGSVSEAYEGPWRVQVAMPWESLSRAVEIIVQGRGTANDLADISAFVFIVALTIIVTLKYRPPYWLYLWPTVGFILLRNFDMYPLHGLLRYTICLFPIFIALAYLLRRPAGVSRLLRITYLIVGFGLQVALVVAFAAWQWVS